MSHQRQHLDRLAEPHVVGQTRAEAERREQMEPAHADLLIRPQRRLQSRSAPATDRGARVPQGRAVLRASRAAMRPRRPPTTRAIPRVSAASSPGRAPATSRIASANVDAFCLRQPLDALELGDASAAARRASPRPSVPRMKCSPSVAASSCREFLLRQCLAVERDLHLEVEQRARAQSGRRLCADGRGRPRARRPARRSTMRADAR